MRDEDDGVTGSSSSLPLGIYRPGLDVIFVGFNPSLPAWRTGHYYANPGNRFYRLLHETGLTPRLLLPVEDRSLPDYGIGVTDLVALPSARADQVPAADFRAASAVVVERLVALAPRAVCCNGVGVFRHLRGRAPVRLGIQPEERIGAAAVFVVPSTSGLVNGRAAERSAAFRELAVWLGRDVPAR
jgi:TDG/mug DNA glycosylase family protein